MSILPNSLKNHLLLLRRIDKAFIRRQGQFQIKHEKLEEDYIKTGRIKIVCSRFDCSFILDKFEFNDINVLIVLMSLRRDGICSQLLEYVDYIDYRDECNNNLLMLAIELGLEKTARLLVDKFPSDHINIYGQTALMLAAGNVYSGELFDEIFSRDINPFHIDNDGNAAIYYAAEAEIWYNFDRLLEIPHNITDGTLERTFYLCARNGLEDEAISIIAEYPALISKELLDEVSSLERDSLFDRILDVNSDIE